MDNVIAAMYCLLLLFVAPSIVVAFNPSLSKQVPLKFEGSMLGVAAEIDLYRHQECAEISLTGFPLGGTVSGLAEFENDEWAVGLDDTLKLALSRRRVRIESVGMFRNESQLWVMLVLPLIGRRVMWLDRKN